MFVVEGLAFALAFAAFLAAVAIESRFQSFQPVSLEIPRVELPSVEVPLAVDAPVARAAAE